MGGAEVGMNLGSEKLGIKNWRLTHKWVKSFGMAVQLLPKAAILTELQPS